MIESQRALDGASCSSCHEGHLKFDIRDVMISHRGIEDTVPKIQGWFCDSCDDINFDDSTDSADRYADCSDRLVHVAREKGVLAYGKQLKRARESLGLSQQEAARLAGGGHNAFSRYETGVAQPMQAVINLFVLLERHPYLLSEITSTH